MLRSPTPFTAVRTHYASTMQTHTLLSQMQISLFAFAHMQVR